MDRTAFLLRMPKSIKRAIGERASIEDRSQTDLILEAIQRYMSKRTNGTSGLDPGVRSSFTNNLKLAK